MNDYATDDEQVEALKRWWDDNGKFVIGGIVIGVAALFGWNRYSDARDAAAEAASTVYTELLEHVGAGDTAAAATTMATLQDAHGDSTYADYGWLAMAKVHMDGGDSDAAISALTSMLDTNVHAELKGVARLRLAQIYLHVERHDDAYDVLQDTGDGLLRSRIDELIGDIEVARGNPDAARVAYQSALAAPPAERSIDPTFVELKLAKLPVAESVDSAASENDETAETAETPEVSE